MGRAPQDQQCLSQQVLDRHGARRGRLDRRPPRIGRPHTDAAQPADHVRHIRIIGSRLAARAPVRMPKPQVCNHREVIATHVGIRPRALDLVACATFPPWSGSGVQPTPGPSRSRGTLWAVAPLAARPREPLVHGGVRRRDARPRPRPAATSAPRRHPRRAVIRATPSSPRRAAGPPERRAARCTDAAPPPRHHAAAPRASQVRLVAFAVRSAPRGGRRGRPARRPCPTRPAGPPSRMRWTSCAAISASSRSTGSRSSRSRPRRADLIRAPRSAPRPRRRGGPGRAGRWPRRGRPRCGRRTGGGRTPRGRRTASR